ncbi:MAG TPA: DUF3311 domain-containing protein [Acidimicrobiales bacterium]|nr:DUF3311 domain-containing protein [Acidimicrobiales bacterium]
MTDSASAVPGRPLRVADAPVSYVVSALLLAAAFVALLWVPSYAHLTPTLGGIPFFYWYSMLWLVINAICQFIAYMLLVTVPRRRAGQMTTGVRP